MPQVDSASDPVGLYNSLVTLSCENDQPQIQQIKWRLQNEVRKRPDDVVAAVALIEACRMGGHRAEAVEQAERVWGRHTTLGLRIQENYLGLLVDLGLYDRARALFEQLTSDDRLAPADSTFVVAACAAVAAGDVPWLERIGASGIPGNAATIYLKVIEYSGLADHFAAHRRIVNDVVLGHQCGVAVSAIRDPGEPDGLPGIFSYFFVPEERPLRRQMERSIHQALEDYYAGQGLAPAAYLGYFDTMLTAVPFPER